MKASRRDVFGLAVLAALPAGNALGQVAACDTPPTLGTGPEPLPPPLQVGHFSSGTAKLWYWECGGQGPAVLLMHPASGSGHVWRYQQQAFVNAGLRVIGYSRRGAEGSDRGQPGDSTADQDDLRALLDHLAVDRVHLVGCAGGAFVAKDFAISRADRLKSLVLANTLLGVRGPAVDEMLDAIRLPELQNLSLATRELGPAYRTANPAGVARWTELTLGRARRTFPGPPPAGPDRSSPAPSLPPPGDAARLETLRTVKAPVLLIAGEADLLAPPPLMEAFRQFLPDSRLRLLRACGHSAYWEVPDAFNAAVIDFVGQVERGS